MGWTRLHNRFDADDVSGQALHNRTSSCFVRRGWNRVRQFGLHIGIAGLGMPNPEEELLKAKLVSKISEVIENYPSPSRRNHRTAAVQSLRTLQRTHGNYSVERLYRFLTRLGAGFLSCWKIRPTRRAEGLRSSRLPHLKCDRVTYPRRASSSIGPTTTPPYAAACLPSREKYC